VELKEEVVVKKEEVIQVSRMVETNDEDDAIRQASEILSQHVGIQTPMESYSKDGEVAERRVYLHGEKRKVPAKRGGITVSAKIGTQQIWLRTGEYPDGRLAEIFIDMYKEGAGFRSTLNMFAISVSMGLQYGVPLEKYVENFLFTRFEPSGFTDHPNIKSCTSVIDFVFKVLGMEYLGRTDYVQVLPKGIQKKKFENLAKLAETTAPQETMDLPEKKEEVEVSEVQDQATLPTMEKEEAIQDASSAALSEMMGDAPACPTCGHVTVRNGTCYKCLNCGDSLGCS
ncbi:MAG: vitamin B12-dependent ribonucleotide reductase, partial [Candidatus Magasanikbacteria bacterium]|nr:vitamin B12-dependent ribonucleotide reductase [Candidatus Magasanikbacteria bacterium]